MSRICKQFTFHAAHVLPNHAGQCRNPHGHSYKLEVIVTGIIQPVDKTTAHSSEGMILDFAVLKGIYKSRVEPYVEHMDLNDTLVRHDIIPASTCELLARWIAQRFADALKDSVHVSPLVGERLGELTIRLWETPTSWAETTVDIHGQR